MQHGLLCNCVEMVHWKLKGSPIVTSMLSPLTALFNNVSTFLNLSCMALHAISVFDKV